MPRLRTLEWAVAAQLEKVERRGPRRRSVFGVGWRRTQRQWLPDEGRNQLLKLFVYITL